MKASAVSASAEASGYEFDVAQANHSRSTQNILRGLHYQIENVQAKLIWATLGDIYDVIVDLRRSSPDFGHWYGVTLSGDNRRRLLCARRICSRLPCAERDSRDHLYLTSDIYNPAGERFLRWNCPEIGIEWPVDDPTLNARDANAPGFNACETYA